MAAIHGNAFGGGLELAQACHYRVATKDAKVGQPEVLLGIIPGAGGTQRLPRLCGAALALQMSTDGKPVAASKARAAGILDEIVEGDLLAGAIRFAQAKAAAQRDPPDRDIADHARRRPRPASTRASRLERAWPRRPRAPRRPTGSSTPSRRA